MLINGLLLVLFGLGLSMLVVILFETGHIGIWWLMASLSFIGVAQGTVIRPNQTLTLAGVPLEYAGSPGAIMPTGQRIGTAVGIAVVTATVFTTPAVSSIGDGDDRRSEPDCRRGGAGAACGPEGSAGQRAIA